MHLVVFNCNLWLNPNIEALCGDRGVIIESPRCLNSLANLWRSIPGDFDLEFLASSCRSSIGLKLPLREDFLIEMVRAHKVLACCPFNLAWHDPSSIIGDGRADMSMALYATSGSYVSLLSLVTKGPLNLPSETSINRLGSIQKLLVSLTKSQLHGLI